IYPRLIVTLADQRQIHRLIVKSPAQTQFHGVFRRPIDEEPRLRERFTNEIVAVQAETRLDNDGLHYFPGILDVGSLTYFRNRQFRATCEVDRSDQSGRLTNLDIVTIGSLVHVQVVNIQSGLEIVRTMPFAAE